MAGRYGNVNTGRMPQPDGGEKPPEKFKYTPRGRTTFSPEAARAAGAAGGRDPQSDARVRDSALRVTGGQRPALIRFNAELAALADGNPNFDDTPYTGGFGEDRREQRESYGPEINAYFAQQYADQKEARELAYLQSMSRQAAAGSGPYGGTASPGLGGGGRAGMPRAARPSPSGSILDDIRDFLSGKGGIGGGGPEQPTIYNQGYDQESISRVNDFFNPAPPLADPRDRPPMPTAWGRSTFGDYGLADGVSRMNALPVQGREDVMRRLYEVFANRRGQ